MQNNVWRICTKIDSQLDIMVKKNLKILKNPHLSVYSRYNIVLCKPSKNKNANIHEFFHFVAFTNECGCNRIHYLDFVMWIRTRCFDRRSFTWLDSNLLHPRREAKITFNRLDKKQCKMSNSFDKRFLTTFSKQIVSLSRGGDGLPRFCLPATTRKSIPFQQSCVDGTRWFRTLNS